MSHDKQLSAHFYFLKERKLSYDSTIMFVSVCHPFPLWNIYLLFMKFCMDNMPTKVILFSNFVIFHCAK